MKHLHRQLYDSLIAAALLLSSCTATHEDANQVNELPPIYPDYTNVTIPVNIAPLNFLIKDPKVTDVEVVANIQNPNGSESKENITVANNGKNVKFSSGEWKDFLQQAAGKKVNVQVYTRDQDKEWTQYKAFTWNVVGDSIDPYLTYRLIEPDYEVWNQATLHRELAREDTRRP